MYVVVCVCNIYTKTIQDVKLFDGAKRALLELTTSQRWKVSKFPQFQTHTNTHTCTLQVYIHVYVDM